MDLEYVWAAAGVVFGLAVGLLFVGYLVKPAILNWEGSASMQKLFFSVGVFLAGGGGGAAIMATFSQATPWYLLGVGLGIIWGCFHKPVLIITHTYESVLQVVQLSESLCDKIQDAGRRATAILAILAPPVSSRKTIAELGESLGDALDDAAKEGGGE